MRTYILQRDAHGKIQIPDDYNHQFRMSYVHHKTPTVDPGFYHRHRLEAENQWELTLAVDKITAHLKTVKGYVPVTHRRFDVKYGPMTCGVDFIYAIDGPIPPEVKGDKHIAAILYPPG